MSCIHGINTFVRESLVALVIETMELAKIREIAQRVADVEEVSCNEEEKTIYFLKTSSDTGINVNFAAGIVDTIMYHPRSGKTQLFRRNLTYSDLEDILNNPRFHTNKGFYSSAPPSTIGIKRARTEDDSPRTAYLETERDEAALEKQLQELNKQRRETIKKLKLIHQKKEHTELADQVLVELKRAKMRARSIMINVRGNKCVRSLQLNDRFPSRMANVACLALHKGGYAAVMDDGSLQYTSLPPLLDSLAQNQGLTDLSYIALGPDDQYYIAMKDGTALQNGPSLFLDALDVATSAVKYVAFGAGDTFFVAFEDGTFQWSDDVPEQVVSAVQRGSVNNVWLGIPQREYGNIPYFVSYGRGGRYIGGFLPGVVQDWLDLERVRRPNIRQLLACEGCFLVRHS